MYTEFFYFVMKFNLMTLWCNALCHTPSLAFSSSTLRLVTSLWHDDSAPGRNELSLRFLRAKVLSSVRAPQSTRWKPQQLDFTSFSKSFYELGGGRLASTEAWWVTMIRWGGGTARWHLQSHPSTHQTRKHPWPWSWGGEGTALYSDWHGRWGRRW